MRDRFSEWARLLVALALFAPAVALGWGFDGHRRLASKVHEPLPTTSCLRQWIAANQGTGFQSQSVNPDQWRIQSNPAYDPNEAPRHYLEIDWYSSVPDYPREWAAAQALFGQYAVKNGQVPWRVEEYYGKLVLAFRGKVHSEILTNLAVMSHYVTDAFSVLHNTKNFDPNGLHARWESDMLGSATRIDGVSTLTNQYYGTVGKADPRNNIFDVVIIGNGLVAQLIAADGSATSATAGAACTYDSNCSSAQYCIQSTCRAFDMPGFYSSVKDLTARRWGDALTVFASMVATAWIEAGSPTLTGMAAGCVSGLPQGEVVLKGYPPPGGFTHPDGGQPPPKDGGAEQDAGLEGADAGGFDGGGFEPVSDPAPEGCQGCGGARAAMLFPFFALALLHRRRS